MQQFSNLATPDRNNFVTSIFDFLEPRLSLLKPVLQGHICVTNGLVVIGNIKTLVPKTPGILKDFFSLLTLPINFHIRYLRQMNFPPSTGVNNIVTCPINVSQTLKSLNILAIPMR